jgi:hypothetical protein
MMNMSVYRVIAKSGLSTIQHDHTWVKGLDYEVVEENYYFTLASEQGHLNYMNSARDEVLSNFEKVEINMALLTMESLEYYFFLAKDLRMNYIAVSIRMEGFALDEVIINGSVNFEDKLAYYKKTYDSELKHKFAEGISIVGFTYGNTFAEIEDRLIG